MTKTMKMRIDILTEVQEYIIRTSNALDLCIAMDLCVKVQSLKDELTGGELLELDRGEEIPG